MQNPHIARRGIKQSLHESPPLFALETSVPKPISDQEKPEPSPSYEAPKDIVREIPPHECCPDKRTPQKMRPKFL